MPIEHLTKCIDCNTFYNENDTCPNCNDNDQSAADDYLDSIIASY